MVRAADVSRDRADHRADRREDKESAMLEQGSGKSNSGADGAGDIFLDFVPDLYYTTTSPKKPESEENVGIEVNFHLGERPIKIDNGDVLDPRLVAFVRALARRAAAHDFEASLHR